MNLPFKGQDRCAVRMKVPQGALGDGRRKKKDKLVEEGGREHQKG